MKTTKNVTITENNGFTVRNNYQVVATTNNAQEAEKIAYEVAKKENKNIAINYFFGTVKMTFTVDEMANVIK